MKTKRRIRKRLVAAAPGASIQALASLMRDRHVGAVVVTERGRPVGIVTDRDLVSRVLAAEVDPAAVQARDVMSANLILAREGASLADVTERMRARGIRRVPVVDGRGRLINVLTLDDILVVLGEEIANLGRAILTGIGKEYGASVRGRSRRQAGRMKGGKRHV